MGEEASRGPTRVAMGVEYDGSAFAGWQVQAKGVRTVQACLTAAVARVANHSVSVHCAGRTDAGVHALEQVVHFDTTARRAMRAWTLGTNANLPTDISVRWATSVGPEFHARFSATARHYRYLILTRPTRSPLQRERAVWVHRPLSLERMQAAAMTLVGEHDFSSFRALGCQAKSPIRRIHYLDLRRRGDCIELCIGANGFLHHMVRNIVGVLLAIGRGDAPVSWPRDLLALRDRSRAGVTAPPHGLYLARVDYPDTFRLPQEAPTPRDSRRPGEAAPMCGDR